MNRRKHGKGFRTVLTVLAVLIALYAVFCLTCGRFFYPDFYADATKVQTIPGLLGGFVPQGVSTDADRTFICGYFSGDTPSCIYVLENGASKKVNLNREDGTVYGGHAGGMTVNGEWIYISNASKIFVLRTEDVLNAENGGTATFTGHFDVPCRASFCSSDGDVLYVGEYHADGYETDASHVLETADGTHSAFVYAYLLNADAPFGVDPEPALVYSVPDKVQGFARKDGAVVLSCSAGLSPSELCVYRESGGTDGAVDHNGRSLPLVVLDSARAIRTVRAPHMSEDLEFDGNGDLLVAFEAGTRKFGGGLLPFSIRSVMRLSGSAFAQ